MCWSPLDHRTVRDKASWHRESSHRCSLENPLQNPHGRATRRAAKDVVGQRGNLQKHVDRSEKGDEQNGKPPHKLDGGNGPAGREAESSKHEIPDDVYNSRGDDLVEGILDEASKPAPEEPFEFRDDEERYEDWPHKNTNSSGNESVSDDNDGDGLGC